MPRAAAAAVVVLATLAGGCAGAASRPAARPAETSPAPVAPAVLGADPAAAEIAPGETHRYRLAAGPGRWLTVEVDQREADVDARIVDAAGQVVVQAVTPGNWKREELDLLTGEGGPHVLEIAAVADAERAGGYRVRLLEDRPARADDPARLAARRELRGLDPAAHDGSPQEQEQLARELLTESGVDWDASEEARLADLLGTALAEQRRWEESAAVYRRGLEVLGDGGALATAAQLRLGLAAALAELGLEDEAREEHQRAVELARAGDDDAVFRNAVNLAAFFLYGRREIAAAIEHLEGSLAVRRPDEHMPGLVDSHLNLAIFRYTGGDLGSALDHYEQAASLAREHAVEAARFVLLRTGGTLYRSAGDVEKALTAFEQALALTLAEHDEAAELSIRIHLAALLLELGEYQESRRHLVASERLAERLGAAGYRTRARVYLAWVELGDGNPAAAAALLAQDEGSDLSHELANNVRYTQAVAATRLGQYEKALALLVELAGRAEAGGFDVTAAQALRALGELHLERGALDEAAPALARALELAVRTGNPLRQASAHSLLAELEARRGRPAPALGHAIAAIEVRESVRSQLVDPELRSSYLARWRDDFERAIELSLLLAATEPEAGYPHRAFRLSEAAHARTLTELLAEASVDVRLGISDELLAAEREADHRLALAQSELLSALGGRADSARVEELRQQLEAARQHREEVEREIRRLHPRYAEIVYPRPPGVDEVQSWLPEGSALLEYAVGERSTTLFVVTRDDFSAVPLSAGAEWLAAEVAAVRREIHAPALARRRLADRLSELTSLLIAPALPHLAGVEHLLIVPDRDLYLLPFEALGDPSAPEPTPGGLLHRWTVSYLPSAAVLPHLGRETHPSWRHDLLVLAAPPPIPAADGFRGGGGPSALPPNALPPLPGAVREAERIAELFPASDVKLFVGEEARESLLKRPGDAAGARRLHIASHGVISVEDAEASYILLAGDSEDDGRLHLDEVFNLELDAELVVLSGCDTALGPRLAGEGLIGMVRGFLYAGARDLVVSLWPVADQGTAELMIDFYGQLVAGRPPAQALRQSKLATIEQGGAVAAWAPFIVYGSARSADPPLR